MSTTTAEIPLLEREEALTSLAAALEQAATGSGRVVLVTGEAGIGKTSLVGAFARERDHVRKLSGGCDALFTATPLGPVWDIARQTGGELLAQLEAGAGRTALFGALLAELGRTPTLAVFEDVHWADEATLDALKYLSRRIDGSSCLLVLTYRDDEVGARHPLRLLLGDLRSSFATRIGLVRLSSGAVDRLAELTERPADGVHAATGGNPFFVTEVLAAGSESVPASVRDAVLARAFALPADARAVLDLASLVPGRIEHRLLRSVLEPDTEAVAACVDAGMLVTTPDSLAFRHELARLAVLEALEPLRQAELDRRVLAELESWPGRDALLPRLAHHAAALRDGPAILRYAPAAAARAASVGSHREAADYYGHAVAVAGALLPAERAQLLDAYGAECQLVGWQEEAIEARDAAAALWSSCNDPRGEARSLASSVVARFALGRTEDAERASRRAVEVLATEPECAELALAYRTQAALSMWLRDTDDAVLWGERAIGLAERFDDVETVVHALNSIGSAYVGADELERGRPILERSLELARGAGLDAHVSNAYGNLGSGAGEVHQFAIAHRALENGVAFAVEHDLDYSETYQLSWLALTSLYLGRWESAATSAALVLRRETGGAVGRIMALLALGRLRARRGDPDVWSVLDEALELANRTATLQRIAPVHCARAEAAWLMGEKARTVSEARECYPLALEKRHAWFVGELAYWQWLGGELDGLPPYAAEPFARQVQGCWSEAAETWRARGCPYETARALAESASEQALRDALETFDELGALPAARMARQALRTLGVRSLPRGPRASTRDTPAGLTTREVEVIRLVAEGLPNAEIAERLVLSPRTVEHHVAAGRRKLDARTRGEAAATAARLGLLEDR